MAISFMVTCHLKQPYASASPTPHDKGRACRYTGQAVRALPIRVITPSLNRIAH
ncbi:BnaA05g16420D [Brassica napus]|uniref:BnaA05g16420D protein n=1 Tax=Brassica napus TaxID=3708 RepID=A0A078HDR2_BRANA|nr:BnaA05g16420D [Brassica napus]